MENRKTEQYTMTEFANFFLKDTIEQELKKRSRYVGCVPIPPNQVILIFERDA